MHSGLLGRQLLRVIRFPSEPSRHSLPTTVGLWTYKTVSHTVVVHIEAHNCPRRVLGRGGGAMAWRFASTGCVKSYDRTCVRANEAVGHGALVQIVSCDFPPRG